MNIERITTLLASGLKPTHVASIVGCTPSYISQLAKDSEEFRNMLELKNAEVEEKDVEEIALTAKYHAAEHALIDQVMTLLHGAELRDVTNTLKVISERQDKVKARVNPVISTGSVINNIVQINIPQHALPELTLTKNHEVISVNDINLAPLTSEGVSNLFNDMRKNKEKEKENECLRISQATERALEKASGEELSREAKAFLDSRDDFLELQTA